MMMLIQTKAIYVQKTDQNILEKGESRRLKKTFFNRQVVTTKCLTSRAKRLDILPQYKWSEISAKNMLSLAFS